MIRADTTGGTDGRTDGRTDGVKPIYPPTTSLFGGYNNYVCSCPGSIYRQGISKHVTDSGPYSIRHSIRDAKLTNMLQPCCSSIVLWRREPCWLYSRPVNNMGPFHQYSLTESMAWLCMHNNFFLVSVITHVCPIFNGGLPKLLLD